MATVATGAQYLAWRLSTVAGTGVPGTIFWIIEVVNFAALALTFGLIWRAPGRPVVPGALGASLDVFITVCGEPARMIRDTVAAVLAIDYPHATYVLNDGRIAGKPGWQEIDDLAAQLGVVCFTRTTGRRGKAANLNYAFARTTGELVLTIDADHHASADLAHQTLGYFADPQVAFVTTPQQYYATGDESLYNSELFFYRVIQPAKDAANSAFSCGNGVIYRRAALASIEGFSEWSTVEDVHTSYRLHAAGWRSAYHNHAVTTGTAPPTLAELARQRLRWATDSVRLFVWDNPLRKPGLTWSQRAHYLHTTSFYVIAATQTVFLISPALYLLGGISIMRTSTAPLLWHSLPYYATIAVFFFGYCGPRDALRVVRQQLVLSPVYLAAVVKGLMRRSGHGSVTEKVTPASLSWAVLSAALLLALSLVTLAVAGLDPKPGGYVAAGWAAWFAFALAGPSTAFGRSHRLRRSLRALVHGAIVLGLVVVAVPALHRNLGPLAPGPQWQVREALVPPARGVYFGAFNPTIIQGSIQLAAWERRHGVRLGIVNSYQQWLSNDTAFHADRARMVAAAGGVLMITWEPWAKPSDSVHRTSEPQVRLRRIVAGDFDRYIWRWARAAAGYRGPLLIRFMQEMNGNWYPWSYTVNGNSPQTYVAAWRHVHDIFVAAGATNVRWVWAINSFTGLGHSRVPIRRYYPGRRYVDWVSATGFNWAAPIPAHPAGLVFDRTLRALDRLHKPIMISEVGTADARVNARQWITSVVVGLPRRDPQVRAIVWFDDSYDRLSDFRLRGRLGAAFDSVVARAPALRSVPQFIPVAS